LVKRKKKNLEMKNKNEIIKNILEKMEQIEETQREIKFAEWFELKQFIKKLK
jgi:hypothetical protein